MKEIKLGVVNAIEDKFKVQFVMHDVDMAEMREKIFGQLDEEMIPGIGAKDCKKCKNFSKRLPLPEILNNLRDDFLLNCLVLVFENYARIGEPVPIELAKTYSYLCGRLNYCEPMSTQMPMFVDSNEGKEELSVHLGKLEIMVNYLDN